MTPEDVVLEARKWVGTPLIFHGRTCGVAADCLGLVEGVAQAFGQTVYDKLDYGPMPPASKAIEVAETNLVMKHDAAVESVQLIASDVVLLCLGRAKEPKHLGLIGSFKGRLTLIHASGDHGKVVEHSLSDFWRGRVFRSYGFPGVEV